MKFALGDCGQEDCDNLGVRTPVMTFGSGKEGHEAELDSCLLPRKMVLSVTALLPLIFISS